MLKLGEGQEMEGRIKEAPEPQHSSEPQEAQTEELLEQRQAQDNQE